jgi:hypothetical protein
MEWVAYNMTGTSLVALLAQAFGAGHFLVFNNCNQLFRDDTTSRASFIHSFICAFIGTTGVADVSKGVPKVQHTQAAKLSFTTQVANCPPNYPPTTPTPTLTHSHSTPTPHPLPLPHPHPCPCPLHIPPNVFPHPLTFPPGAGEGTVHAR